MGSTALSDKPRDTIPTLRAPIPVKLKVAPEPTAREIIRDMAETRMIKDGQITDNPLKDAVRYLLKREGTPEARVLLKYLDRKE